MKQKIVNNNQNTIIMAGFKGTRNENGRPKGTPNKNTAQIRDSFQLLVESNISKLKEDIDKLEPKDRIRTIIDLAKFVLPTLKAIEYNDSIDESRFKPVTINIIQPKDDN
ncbi:hypothetical protein FFWV33_16120 [Flavobacterium faecale]|uniref:DUF5681 domain-containing protein n=1 Tax=Flavobacterium faecale TaxID=1355330 RepID=A0A2S1LGR5_9FLAO|nr:hypothetical protein [Flavobacterium faecale]AWG22944.1 hypothetical protein FFWV33_16120 [Flavobacterium faecale]